MQHLCTLSRVNVSIFLDSVDERISQVASKIMSSLMRCQTAAVIVSNKCISSTYTDNKKPAVPSVTHYLHRSLEIRVILIVIYIYSVLYCKLLYYLYRNVDHGKVLYLPIPCI